MNFKNLGVFFAAIFMLFAVSNTAKAASAETIDAEVNVALTKFYEEVKGGKALLAKANAVLVFPNVVKAGFGFGGEYGEGALRINGATVDYYNVASASVGLQIGVQVRTEVILFMEPSALEGFRRGGNWEAGIDGSIALVTLGVGGEIDTNTINKPIVGFMISNKGLMYNLTFEGAKISKIHR